jgi:hypothetical protein
VKTGVSAIGKPGPQPPPPVGGGPSAPVLSAAAATPSAPLEHRAQPIRWKAALIFHILSSILMIPYLLICMDRGSGDEKTIFLLSSLPIDILSVVFWAILHYQCWKAIPERFRSLTPGRAVGFLFIPFFNFYWAFLTWPKLADDLASWQTSMGNPRPTQLKGLAMTYAILFVLSFTLGLIPVFGILLTIVELIMFIILYGALVKAINRANG